MKNEYISKTNSFNEYKKIYCYLTLEKASKRRKKDQYTVL